MLIRIKQIRRLTDGDFGTDIPLGAQDEEQTVLQFRPLDPDKPDRDHVCDVEDPDHVATLLAIREGFEVHSSELKKKGDEGDAARKAAKKVGDKAPEKADETAPDFDAMTRDELVAQVTEKTGKAPNPSLSKKRLIALLTEDAE